MDTTYILCDTLKRPLQYHQMSAIIDVHSGALIRPERGQDPQKTWLPLSFDRLFWNSATQGACAQSDVINMLFSLP